MNLGLLPPQEVAREREQALRNAGCFDLLNLNTVTHHTNTVHNINNVTNDTNTTENIHEVLDGKIIDGNKYVLHGNLNSGVQIMKLLQ
mmetsp:Transcript_674/g.809  ORF Transcript_674/g.809 Transcript_674/m.809 type:complete len:88 (+) Transcript_674:71-334(+)